MYAENFTGTQPRWLPGIVVEVDLFLIKWSWSQGTLFVDMNVDSVHKRYTSEDEETPTDVQDTDPLLLPESQDRLLYNGSSTPHCHQPSEPPPLPLLL